MSSISQNTKNQQKEPWKGQLSLVNLMDEISGVIY